MRAVSIAIVFIVLTALTATAQWEQVGRRGGEISIKAQLGKTLIGTAGVNIYRSTDWGASWVIFNTGLPLVNNRVGSIETNGDYFYNFIEGLPFSFGNTGLFIAKETDTQWTYVSLSFIDGRRPFTEIDRGDKGLKMPLIFTKNNILTYYPSPSANPDTNAGFYRSTDAGISWERQNDPISQAHPWEAHAYFDYSRLYVFMQRFDTNRSRLVIEMYRSNDTAKTWEKIVVPAGDSVYSIPYFLDDTTLYVFVKPYHDARTYLSTDGGKTWQSDVGPLPQNTKDWHVSTMFKYNGRIYSKVGVGTSKIEFSQYVSDDNGLTWRKILFQDSIIIENIRGTDSLYIVNNSIFTDSSLTSFSQHHFTTGIMTGRGTVKYVSGTTLYVYKPSNDSLPQSISISTDNGVRWNDYIFHNNAYLIGSADWVKDHSTLYATGISKTNFQNYILKSLDDGQSWDTLHTASSNPWSSNTYITWISKLFASGDTLIVRFEDMQLVDSMFWYSINGGVSWTVLPLPYIALEQNFVSNVVFSFTNNVLYFFPAWRTYSSFFQSYDLGATWIESYMPPGAETYIFTDVAVLGNNILISDNGERNTDNPDESVKSHLFLSQDSLNSYTSITNGLGDSTVLRFFKYVDGILYATSGKRDNGLFVRGQSKAYYSIDSGLTWRQLPGNVLSDPNIFIGSEYIFMSGEELWRLPKSFASVHQSKSTTATSISIDNCFPNPATTETTITYSLPKRSLVTLRAFDITGKLLSTIANETGESGQYETTWNTYSLPSGSYVIQLLACGEMVSKVVLVSR